jgi:hypothetical protein
MWQADHAEERLQAVLVDWLSRLAPHVDEVIE